MLLICLVIGIFYEKSKEKWKLDSPLNIAESFRSFVNADLRKYVEVDNNSIYFPVCSVWQL